MNIHASPKKNPSRAPETGDVTVGPRLGGANLPPGGWVWGPPGAGWGPMPLPTNLVI